MKLDDEVLCTKSGTRYTFHPAHGRGYEAGPEGLEIIGSELPISARIAVRTSRAGATGGLISAGRPLGASALNDC